MTYSAVPTKNTGDTLAASDWDTYVRDNFSDHEARISANSFSGAIVTRASNQSVPNSTFTAISWTAETTDQGGWIATTASTFTVPSAAMVSGYTSITVSLAIAIYWDTAASGTTRSVRVLKNGTEYCADSRSSTGGAMGITIVAPDIVAVAGDTFSIEVEQVSGGALDLIGGTLPLMATIHRTNYF